MRHSNQGRVRQQVQFLRRQFLQNGDFETGSSFRIPSAQPDPAGSSKTTPSTMATEVVGDAPAEGKEKQATSTPPAGNPQPDGDPQPSIIRTIADICSSVARRRGGAMGTATPVSSHRMANDRDVARRVEQVTFGSGIHFS